MYNTTWSCLNRNRRKIQNTNRNNTSVWGESMDIFYQGDFICKICVNLEFSKC